MQRTIVLGLLLVTAACGRDRREGQEVALGDTLSMKVDSFARDSAATPTAAPAPTPASEPPAPPNAAPQAPAGDTSGPKPSAATPAPPPPPPVTAEEAAAASATVGKLGLSVYPAKGQSKDQTVRDELACTDWAKQQTGIDPMTVAANTDSAAAAGKEAVDSAAGRAGVRGAARGAAAGAVVGAIAGDAGTGAAVGAVGGAAVGRNKKKAAEKQAAQQGAAAAEAQASGSLTTFSKAMSSCLQGKGYTVN
jgi:Glycine zipper